MNVDHANTHGAFLEDVAPIRQSNLCCEITLPTKPLYSVQDENGEVALCTLSAVNLGALDSIDELEDITEIIVRSLDCLLDYQDYPLKSAEITSNNRRTLGIGVTNLAYYLAKNDAKYSDGSGNELIHKTFEALQFYSLKASNKLAIEFGECPLFSETQYAQGIFPVDSYKKDIDVFCNTKLELDWDSLRKDSGRVCFAWSQRGLHASPATRERHRAAVRRPSSWDRDYAPDPDVDPRIARRRDEADRLA
jgi:ribonucleoside-diphosphate reductase alpha chain